jgi:tripartite-type tricarboxylate transporter receptor subunit TctC
MKSILRSILALIIFSLSPQAHAQITEAPVKIIFPFAAGGSGDAISRLVAEALRAELGRPVIVESRSGAAGRIGVSAVKAAAPDGLTLLSTPIAPMAVYQHFYPSLGYDPFTDFVPVSQIGTFDFSLAVAPSVPAKDLKELVAWVKADEKRASYGSPGAGTLPHFFGLLFGRAAGLPLQHVNYRGSAAALTDLLGDQLPIFVTTTSDLLEAHKAGRIKVLATSDKARSAFLPDVPSFKESGYDIVGTGWYGIFAPAGMSAATVQRYSEIIVKALQNPELRAKLVTLGLQPTGTSSSEFAAIQKADSALWEPVIKASGFKPE